MYPIDKHGDEWDLRPGGQADPDDEIVTIKPGMLHPDVEFEDGMGWMPVVSLVLIIACIVGYLCQFKTGAMAELEAINAAVIANRAKPKPPEKLINMGALVADKVKAGEWWRMVSCMFLHGSTDHILGNLLMLYVLGLACEHAFGRLQFLGLFVLTGMVGAALGVGMDVKCNVGASGAVFGLAGALVGLFYRRRHELHVRDHRVGWVLLIYSLFSFAIGYLNPVIDNSAHVGGFLAGIVFGIFLLPRVLKRESDAGLQPLPVGLFLTAVVVLIAAGIEFIPRFAG